MNARVKSSHQPWGQNRQLLIDIASGKPHKVAAAQRQLLKDNEGLVRCIAHEYLWACNGRTKYSDNAISVEELYHVGQIGMLMAASKFDSSCGPEFAAYATKTIRSRIQMVVHRRGTVYVPPKMRFKIARLLKAERKLEHINDTVERAEAIKKILDLTDESFDVLQKTRELLSRACTSLDEPLRENSSGELMRATNNDLLWRSSVTGEINFGGALAEIDEELPEEPNTKALFDRICASARLNDREMYVLRLFHGLHDETKRNYREIGKLLGVTHQRARQIERRAFEKLSAVAKPAPHTYG